MQPHAMTSQVTKSGDFNLNLRCFGDHGYKDSTMSLGSINHRSVALIIQKLEKKCQIFFVDAVHVCTVSA